MPDTKTTCRPFTRLFPTFNPDSSLKEINQRQRPPIWMTMSSTTKVSMTQRKLYLEFTTHFASLCNSCTEKQHVTILKFSRYSTAHNSGTAQQESSFKSHIVELLKRHRMVVESSIGTKTCHILREALFRALVDSMHKTYGRGAHECLRVIALE